MHHRVLIPAALIGAFVLTLTLAAQAPTTVRVDVRLVNVVATVTDANGRYVSNLTADDFKVEEDGVTQKISHFTQDHEIPVSVGILMDTSLSMDRKIQTATEAVERFINNIHKDDDIFLMTFDRQVSLVQDFTSDRRKLARALDTVSIGGGTLLYDGLLQGLEKVRRGRHDKRAILLISDGMDAGSRRATVESLLRNIRGTEILVYSLGTAEATYADPAEHVPFSLPTPQSVARPRVPVANTPQRSNRGANSANINGVNMRVLTQFAESSGGRAFLLSDTFINDGTSEIDKILTLIADELRSQYTIGYYPAVPDDGRVHSLKVTTQGGYTVRARTGYLAK
jgi:Ca-activated chloride channel homolog